jgi:chemotaxis protein MotA
MIGRFILPVSLTGGIFFSSFRLETGGFGLVSNIHALMIVLGGTLSVLLIAYTWGKILSTIRLLRRAFGSREDIDWTIHKIIDLARNYRKKWSIRILEQEANNLPPGLLKTGLELIAFNFPRDQIIHILHQEALHTYEKYEMAYKILRNLAGLAPAFGLAGTFVQLIRVLDNSTSSQDLLGPLAIAFLSVFYGLILAGFLFAPLANKLKEFMEQSKLHMVIIQDGILGLYDQEHPRAILNKLEIRSSAMALSNQLRIPPQIALLAPGERPVENKIL